MEAERDTVVISNGSKILPIELEPGCDILEVQNTKSL
jgi:hypothetical protein